MLDLVSRIRNSPDPLNASLAFANTWTYFTPSPSTHHEQLTVTGPYAGTLEAFTTGVKLRTRYDHLLPSNSTITRLWSCEASRDIATARYFAAGFFGIPSDYDRTPAHPFELQIIPESPDLGGNTLTPGDTCLQYTTDKEEGHDKGLHNLLRYRSTYLPRIAARLAATNPALPFSEGEIYSMQELCGFETLARGSSPWCAVFSQAEWDAFEYARDVIHYYRAGPGNRYAGAMGWLWLNATTELLAKGPGEGTLWFSFVHDGDVVPMLAALDLFHDDVDLPVSKIETGRMWKTSSVVPMGGRVIFERLACAAASKPGSAEAGEEEEETFVRININDGIVPLPSCSSGPGSSCPLSDFVAYIKKRGQEVGDFREVCGLDEDAPDRIEFLHQRGL